MVNANSLRLVQSQTHKLFSPVTCHWNWDSSPLCYSHVSLQATALVLFMSSLGQCYRTGSSAHAFVAEGLLLKGIKNHESNASCTLEGRSMVCPCRISNTADWIFTDKPLLFKMLHCWAWYISSGRSWASVTFCKILQIPRKYFFCGLKSFLTVFTCFLSS